MLAQTYEYDNNGNRTKIAPMFSDSNHHMVEGSGIENSLPDSSRQMEDVTYTYDSLQRLSSVSYGDGTYQQILMTLQATELNRKVNRP